ncbi:hypothetical protein [Desulfonatronovibrio magnus]|uniref:hypothetical protein n=1 Tax=Desulfonatronovibrio magnus TaxID=698827 RepID=UPI0006990835|nr:hypothetical protein [Desulfonatronovibrio magnus]
MLQQNNLPELRKPQPPKLDERFMINLKGKDFVTYAGLLDLAHQQGLVKLEVQPLQMPTEDNGQMAICLATAVTSGGKVFSDLGDASPRNTNKMIAAHLIRMASTRAKARVLRDITNIGITALEELGGEEYPSSNNNNGNGNGKLPGITEAQKRAIANLGRIKGYTNQDLNEVSKEIFNREVSRLSAQDASELIIKLQQPE